jgi:hypothetical protein
VFAVRCVGASTLDAPYSDGFCILKEFAEMKRLLTWPCRLAVVAVLVGFLAAAPAQQDAAKITVDKEKKTVTVPCQIAPRKINDPAYKEIYPVEVIATWPWHKEAGKGGQKAHETVLVFEPAIKPSMVHKALEELGLKSGTPVMGGTQKDVPQGPEVELLLEFSGPDGQPKRVPVERALVDSKTKKTLGKVRWRFTGSVMSQPDPNKPDKVYGADLTGTLISIFPVTNQTVFQTHLTMAEEKFVKLDTDKELLPKEGSPARLVIQVPAK